VAKLVYSTIASLDGYVADEDGNFGWAVPNEEVHAFINDLDRPLGTYLKRQRHGCFQGCNRDTFLQGRHRSGKRPLFSL
jgi:hypothetical protein